MEVTKDYGPFQWLAQGTLYPDVIESGFSKGPAAVIKTHHNVGGLPEWLNLKVLEPFRSLYKDEVRQIAVLLDIPREFIKDILSLVQDWQLELSGMSLMKKLEL